VAIGASCVENAVSQELGTLLAGQLARAAAIFNVDEVIVLDDGPKHGEEYVSAACGLLARVLQFCETPQVRRGGRVTNRCSLLLSLSLACTGSRSRSLNICRSTCVKRSYLSHLT
jgi:hypothetical protein